MGANSGFGGRLTVDLGAIVRNWQALDTLSGAALTGAVVKADAYGLGLAPVAEALFAAGARFFFVATPDEGMALAPGGAGRAYLCARRTVSGRSRPLCPAEPDAGPVLAGRAPRNGSTIALNMAKRSRRRCISTPA